MSLKQGDRLGPYEIVARIGAGGIGEVYKGRDTRLDRTIAVKILGQDLTARPEVLQRFEREARVISTLNHPNICTLHDVGNDGGLPYLVMEFVEGETLQQRLSRGPVGLAAACRIAIQIGEALEQAHARKIVHRDLKPANVMLTSQGSSVKLLDFGLAKLPAPPLIGGASTVSTVALTIEGTIIGTLQYMSPEQLEGKEADSRSDIFSFGGVLYEMITGRPPFAGNSQAALIAAVMAGESPPVSSLQPMAPPALDHLVRKCLAKDPEERWQNVRDLVSQLRWIAGSFSGSSGSSLPAVAQRPPKDVRVRWRWAGAAAGALLLIAAGTWWMHDRQPAVTAPVVRFEVPPPEGQALTADSLPVLSPDESRIVFNTARDRNLVVRSLDSLDSREVPGTEGGHLPFWSPDGRTVAFFSMGALRKVGLSGGPPVIVTPVRGAAGGSWSHEGVILFSPTPASGLMQVSAAGGKAEPVTSLDAARGETSHAWPWFLPDGRHFLFTAYSKQPEQGGVYIGSLDSAQVTRILPEDTNAQFVPPGLLLYTRRGVLTAQPFDASRLRFAGDPVAVAEKLSAVARPAGAAFSATHGALVYHVSADASRNRLVWFDRNGAALGPLGPPGDYSSPAVSPDGQSLAVASRESTSKARDIWVYDATRGTGTRLTLGAGDNFSPVWSPDSRSVAYLATRGGSTSIFRKLASGAGSEEMIAQAPGAVSLSDWTTGGKRLLLTVQPPGKPYEIWQVLLEGRRQPELLLNGPLAMACARLSPDGKWMAYMSNESGAGGYETYVQTFPPTGNKWRISAATGEYPQWRADGKELLMIESRHYKILSAPIEGSSGQLKTGRPVPLFQGPLGDFSLANYFAVAPGAQKFLLVRADDELSTRPFTVVLNWQAGLRP